MAALSVVEQPIMGHLNDVFEYLTTAAMSENLMKVIQSLNDIRLSLKESVDIAQYATRLINRGENIFQVLSMPCSLQIIHEEVRGVLEKIANIHPPATCAKGLFIKMVTNVARVAITVISRMITEIDDCCVGMEAISIVDLGLCLNEETCKAYFSMIRDKLHNIIRGLMECSTLHDIVPGFDICVSELENLHRTLSLQVRKNRRKAMRSNITEDRRVLYLSFHNEMRNILLHDAVQTDIEFLDSAMRWELQYHTESIYLYSNMN